MTMNTALSDHLKSFSQSEQHIWPVHLRLDGKVLMLGVQYHRSQQMLQTSALKKHKPLSEITNHYQRSGIPNCEKSV